MNMHAKQLIVAVTLLAAAGLALAEQTQYVAADANFVAGKTRAEVVAEVQQAQADGTLSVRDDQYPVLAAGSQRSRDEVRAETRQAGLGAHPFHSSVYFGS
jgi:hypothetical protein